jgi:peptide/nickel transport system substrate-binding protein
MKKNLFFSLAVVVFTLCFAAAGLCDQKVEGKTPQKGGILKIISPTSPRVLGYYDEMGPGDTAAAFPAVEFIMNMNTNRELVPFLAESVKIDEKKLTITFKLRKGIKFHDGSELNAEVMVWNYKRMIDSKKMQFEGNIKSIDIVDPYTVVMNLKEYHNQLIFAYGWVPMYSKQALETKGKEWCRTNPVGTGPFKIVEFKRDNYLKWERFSDYWQKGKPYLDGIEVRYIPDAVTASSMFQTKEADMWLGAPVKDQADLTKKGLKRQALWAGLPNIIYLNNAKTGAPTANLKVREAIEYALDKPAMAKALGFGFYAPLKVTAPDTEWGYDPAYKGRTYDPAKAKKLLAEAGYPNGLKIKLLALAESGGRNNTAETIKRYMDEAGFIVDVDIADPGRFFGSMWMTGWDDMALFFTGLDFNYLATVMAWFGHEPKTNLTSFKRPPEFVTLCKEAVKATKPADQKEYTKKLVRMIADEALMIPLWNSPGAFLHQPYVHSDYFKNGFINWTVADDWMDKK